MGCASAEPVTIAETPTPTPTVNPSLVDLVWQDSSTGVYEVVVGRICIGDWCQTQVEEQRQTYWEGRLENRSSQSITVTIDIAWRTETGATASTEQLVYLVQPGVTELPRTFYEPYGRPAVVVSATASLVWLVNP